MLALIPSEDGHMSYTRMLIAVVAISGGLALALPEANAAPAACAGPTIEVYGNEGGDLVVGIDIAQGTCACTNAWGPKITYRSFTLPKAAPNWNPPLQPRLPHLSLTAR
jgi:hypothetical protein